MVTNFEEQTQELTKDELLLVPYIIQGFRDKTKDSPIKSNLIITKLNSFISEKNRNQNLNLKKVNDVLLRKLVNHIRSNSLLPILASSKGYYISNDPKDIQEQIESLTQRANSIYNCAKGLSNFIKKS